MTRGRVPPICASHRIVHFAERPLGARAADPVLRGPRIRQNKLAGPADGGFAATVIGQKLLGGAHASPSSQGSPAISRRIGQVIIRRCPAVSPPRSVVVTSFGRRLQRFVRIIRASDGDQGAKCDKNGERLSSKHAVGLAVGLRQGGVTRSSPLTFCSQRQRSLPIIAGNGRAPVAASWATSRSSPLWTRRHALPRVSGSRARSSSAGEKRRCFASDFVGATKFFDLSLRLLDSLLACRRQAQALSFITLRLLDPVLERLRAAADLCRHRRYRRPPTLPPSRASSTRADSP